MYQKFHWKLALFGTLITGCILIFATFLCLSISEKEMEKNQYISFLTDVNTTLAHFDSQKVISHQRLSRLETGYQFIIQIYDNGYPLYYQKLKRSREEKELIDTAVRAAKKETEINIFSPSFSRAAPIHEEYTFRHNGETYYASAALISSKHGCLGILLLYSAENIQQDIEKQRIIFGIADIFAIFALFLFFWFFTGRMIRPLEENKRQQIRFISSASHELRAPLSVILSALPALKSAGDKEKERFIDMIGSEGKRMSRLIGDMLFLANSDSGSWRFLFKKEELTILLLDSFEKYQIAAAKKHIHMNIFLPETMSVFCFCDAQRITQALCILLDNAVSYTPEGGKITLSLSLAKKQAKIKVSDTGPGIPDEDKEKVFERFYRAEDSHTDKEHFGLGLCIANEIIKVHRGRLWVEDNVPSGCVFYFTLPLLL